MNFRKICLLHMQRLTNFPYIEKDFDALTDYGLLCKVVEKLNEIVENSNKQNEEITNLYNSFIELKDYVDEYLTGFDEIKEDVETLKSDVSTLSEKVNINIEEIARLDNKIDLSIENLKLDLEEKINNNFNILKTYVDYQDGILDEKINNIQIGLINVYNPTTGLYQPLQIVINNLYEITNKDGLTAEEFDALNLTASGFDAYQITAYEFDSQGKTILS